MHITEGKLVCVGPLLSDQVIEVVHRLWLHAACLAVLHCHQLSLQLYPPLQITSCSTFARACLKVSGVPIKLNFFEAGSQSPDSCQGMDLKPCGATSGCTC